MRTDIEALKQAVLKELAERNENASYHMQKAFAARLRQIAIAKLQSGNGKAAQFLQDEAHRVARDSQQDYIQKYLSEQSKSGFYATELELRALGEVFDVTVSYKETNKPNETTVFLAEKPGAPCITLFYTPRSSADSTPHWHVNKNYDSTYGDGNCLYNAFAQAMFVVVKKEQAAQASRPATPSTPASSEGLSSSTVSITPSEKSTKGALSKQVFLKIKDILKENKEAIEFQKTLSKSFSSRSKSDGSANAAYEEHLKNISAEERKQIFKDRQLALKIAKEELRFFKQRKSTASSQSLSDLSTPRHK